MTRWIRWGGLIGFVVVLAVAAGVWLMLVDGLVERIIESQGTRLVGAKVELDAADLSFLPAGLTLTGLQVTSPEEPMTNAVEVGRIAATLDGLNLLRRKIIVEEASAEGVRFGTPRAYSGAIERPPREEEIEPSADGGGAVFTMPSLEIPDVEEILAKEELESLALIKELKADVEGARETWEERLQALPGKETFDEYRARIERLKGATKGGVAGALGGLGEMQALKEDIERDLAALRAAKAGLEERLGKIKSGVERVARAPQEDLRRLQEKYSLSPQGLANLSETLLGQVIGEWARRGAAWYARLKPVLERAVQARAAQGGPEVVKPLRAAGVDVRFTEARPLPDFLVRRAAVSVQLDVGDLAGRIENVTPDQDILGKPTTFTFSGEKLTGARSVSLRGVLDHVVSAEPHDRVNLQVAGYRIDHLPLSKQASWPVAVTKGLADLQVRGAIQGETVKATIRSAVKSLTIEAGKVDEPNRLTKALSSAVSGISQLDVEAEVVGTLQDYEIRIRSGLDKVLQQAAGRVVGDLSASLNKDLSAAISAKVDGPLRDLRQRVGDVQELQGILAGRVSNGQDLLASLLGLGPGPKGPSTSLPKELPGGFKLPF